MSALRDPAVDDMYGVDVGQDFERFSLQWHPDETSTVGDDADCDSVLLECNGELVDAASVMHGRIRKSVCGFETLLFICPRCHEPHESVRFR